jgi:hypothetical protein
METFTLINNGVIGRETLKDVQLSDSSIELLNEEELKGE